MICPNCEHKMPVNQTKNFTDPDQGFVYVERRRVCGNCGYRTMTVEIPQEFFRKGSQ